MRKIPLSGKYGKGKYFLVDDEDYPELIKHKWFVTGRDKNYVVRSTITYLHREILNNPLYIVDHINGNSLDNRKKNLRICNSSQNRTNSKRRSDNKSGYVGVQYTPKRSKKKPWRAIITVKGKQLYLGQFSTPQLAAKEYNKACSQYFKEFSRLNTV